MKKRNVLNNEGIVNNIRFLELLIRFDFNFDQLLTFGFFLSNQKDSLYNLGYYISQAKSLKGYIIIFKDKYDLYCNLFEYCVSRIKKITPSGVNVEIYIDGIYKLSNIKEQNKNVNLLMGADDWSLTIYDDLTESYDLKKISEKRTLLKIVWSSVETNEKSNKSLGLELLHETTMHVFLSESKINDIIREVIFYS